jgi:hypothetical protein
MEFNGVSMMSFEFSSFESKEVDEEGEEEEEISFVEEDFSSLEEEPPLQTLEVATDLSGTDVLDERLALIQCSFFDSFIKKKERVKPLHFQTMKGVSLSGYGQAFLLALQVTLVFSCKSNSF